MAVPLPIPALVIPTGAGTHAPILAQGISGAAGPGKR